MELYAAWNNVSVRLFCDSTTFFIRTMAITRRDSVLGLTVRIPARLIGRKQTYTLRVQNPPLLVDTVNVGGGQSAAQTLTVDADKVFSVEYIGVDTLLNTGDRMPFITLRFRDRVENLVDHPTTLSYTNSDNSAQGTFLLTQTSLGNYRADTLRFAVAGEYRLWVDTSSTGALSVIGKNTFTVLTRSVARAEITGLPTTITAGDTIPALGQSLTVRYFDSQNNLTDAGVRPVIVTGTSYRDTLVMNRKQTGVYEAAERIRYTTTGIFTLNLTGVAVANITGERLFTVTPDRVRSVEYIGVDTLLNAGDRTPFVTLRFRDRFQNLVDNATTLYYASSDNAVTGIFPLTLISLGTYRADTLRFPIAGEYRLWVDTSSTGALLVIGKDYFTVETRGPVRVELTNVQTILQAGDTAQAYTFRFYDVLNNLTDLNIRPVVVTGTTYRDTLALTRTNTGVYESERVRYTTSGTFTITPLGIIAANITGDRAFTVLPRPAASVLFTGVIPTLNAGSLQSRFRATLRDTFNNLTDSVRTDSLTVLVPTQAYFSMSTDATIDDSVRSVSAGFFPLTRTSLGVFTADTVRFSEAGRYHIGVAGVGVTTGTAAFIVRPNVDFRVVFENVPDTLVAGDSLKNITVRYFDRSDNPTDNGIGRVVYARAGGSSTATVAMNRVETGVYALESTKATIAGTYNLGVSGISSVNMEGNRQFVLVPVTEPATVNMIISTTAMTSRGSNVTFTLTYRDEFNNLADWSSTLSIVNSEVSSTATFSLQRISKGVYKKTIVVLEPGGYDVTLNTPPPALDIIGPNTFGCSPGRAVRVRFSNIPGNVTAGQALDSSFITLYDVRGRTTNNLTDILTLSTVGAEALGPITFNQRDALKVQHSGVFDIEALTFTKVGTNTFRVDSDVDYLLPATGNYTLNITPAQAATANIQTTPPNGIVSAGAVLSAQIRYRDAFGNSTSSPERLTFSTWGTVVQALPSRTTINGSPVYTLSVRINTTGTYLLTLPNIVVQGTTAVVVQSGAARSVEFLNLASSGLVGEQIPFRVVYRDALGNLTDVPGQSVLFTRSGTPSLTGTIALTSVGTGINAGTANFTTPGTYTLSMTGFASVIGNRTVSIFGVPNPTLTTIAPNNALIGTTVPITLTGANFLATSRVWFGGVPLAADAVTFLSDTQMQATVQLPAESGYSTFWVESPTATSTSNTLLLAVQNPVPVLLSINPNAIYITGTTTLAGKMGGTSLSHSLVPQRGLASDEPVSKGGDAIPLTLGLYAAEPNPFSNSTTFRYGLPEEMQVTLSILDMTGKQQAELVRETTQKAGIHTLTWNPVNIPSGTYMVRVVGVTRTGTAATRFLTIQYIR